MITESLVIIIKLSFNDAMNEDGKDVENVIMKIDVDEKSGIFINISN